ncbi:nitrile hydratase accessory protein [Pannonibacter tanglangensis]|uniref:nitrile hydratase accessory protein n=1 Tax=Pannonibacter tanglangensis TaxID=2750084 RepID=UPI001FCCB7A5|nr:nitrile hydratase accessory protein [Pannonibacter sp. XCT-53]
MSASDLVTASPAIPVADAGPVFRAPWEARVFAMTLAAHEAGLFSWSDWAETLGAELRRQEAGATASGTAACRADDGSDYYLAWLAAFETILTRQGHASPEALARLQDAWDQAARATPHGQPIELRRRDDHT